MKTLKNLFLPLMYLLFISVLASNLTKYKTVKNIATVTKVTSNNFTLINDTKNKVSIYTGTGFVTLNKGSKTSIGCKVGKTVHWAKSGSKKDIIFKIKSSHCGKTLKLSAFL